MVEELSKQDRVAVPSWFSLDTKLGSLAIHLTQSQAFGAEVYITEAGIPDQQCDEETERKVRPQRLLSLSLCLSSRLHGANRCLSAHRSTSGNTSCALCSQNIRGRRSRLRTETTRKQRWERRRFP